MDFTLVYDGPLKANGSTKHKQAIRRYFHPQLKKLWQQSPLKECQDLLEENPPNGKSSVLKKVGDFTFAPLVTEDLRMVAEIDIIFLRPESPGSIITQGGDIDNRMKTLFDALRKPKYDSEIPSGDKPRKGERPFFCLLEDDYLITKISVATDRLLKGTRDNSKVMLIIRITTKVIVGTWDNISLG